jgi:nanoRNase/pAp phosphatase (c-di-AMP/oligoRNAs hydrolase)
MSKKNIQTVKEKNIIINNIINAIIQRNYFILLGHDNPDDDCIASMVAFALLLIKFSKDAVICYSGHIHEHFQYLLNICKYNSIQLLNTKNPCKEIMNNADTIVVCDTPKYSMIEKSKGMENLFQDNNIVIIEIDHHLGADSEYIGHPEYALVAEASSASELVGHIAFALKKRKKLLREYQVEDIFTRNFVLAVLTGIIGDSNMGKFLKTSKEKRYYKIFSNMFNRLLRKKTKKKTNFSDKHEVYCEIQKLSSFEEKCFSYMKERSRYSGSFGYILLLKKDTEYLFKKFCYDDIVSVARSIADTLAEESKKLSLVAYYDEPSRSSLIQFRIRRSQKYKKYDLRNILSHFHIANGGGHEGAIAFRIPQEQIQDLNDYACQLMKEVEKLIKDK